MAPDVSVCVATFRRSRALERLLASLARQKLGPGVSVEVWVVDNDPDGSAASVASRVHDFPHALHWMTEPRRNIARARNCALERARGHWLAFVDDDEEAAEDWLAAFLACVERHPADGYFGPVLARPEPAAASPGWLDVERTHGHPRHATGEPVPSAELRTGNAFVRRAALAGMRFDPELGHSGGEDTELFGRLAGRGARLLWCDEARVTEWVPPERQRVGWLLRRSFRGGVVHTRLAGRAGGGSARAALRALLALGGCVALAPPALLLGRHAALAALQRAAVQAGHLWAHLRGDVSEYGSPR